MGVMDPARHFVSSHDQVATQDVFKFRRFRLNVISFFRLPLGVSEKELRDAIKERSESLHACYVARAERATMEWPERQGRNSGPSYHSPADQRARVNGTADSEDFDFQDTATLIR